MLCQCLKTHQKFAVKLIQNFASYEYNCVKVVREIQLLRSLEKKSNTYNFCTKIHDLVFPTEQELEAVYSPSSPEISQSHIFIIMEHSKNDLRKLLDIGTQTNLTEQHLKVIMYYLLCSLRFLHSANVVHRDLKPSNILINTESQIKLCDFGLSRSLPENLTKSGSGNTIRLRNSIQ